MQQEVRQLAPQPFGSREFRDALGSFATGVTVITSQGDGHPYGMTANAFSSVSLDPLLVLVCVSGRARMHDLLAGARTFAVTILSAEQEPLARFFAGSRPPGREQFAQVRWRPAPTTGCPVLVDGLAFVDCRLTEMHEGGDHSIFLGEVVDLGPLRPDAAPLLFFGGRYRRLVADTPPGAAASGRVGR